MSKRLDFKGLEGVWRTIGGRKVFIRTGQSLSDAMKESKKFKLKKEEDYTEKKYQFNPFEEETNNKYKDIIDKMEQKGTKKFFEKEYKIGNNDSLEEYLNKYGDSYKGADVYVLDTDSGEVDYKYYTIDDLSKNQKNAMVIKGNNGTATVVSDDWFKKDTNGNNYKYDYKDGMLTIKDKKGNEINSFGLSKEDYNENPKYWNERALQEHKEELYWELKGEEKELQSYANFNTDYLHKEKGYSYEQISNMDTDEWGKKYTEWRKSRGEYKPYNPEEWFDGDRDLKVGDIYIDGSGNLQKVLDRPTKDGSLLERKLAKSFVPGKQDMMGTEWKLEKIRTATKEDYKNYNAVRGRLIDKVGTGLNNEKETRSWLSKEDSAWLDKYGHRQKLENKIEDFKPSKDVEDTERRLGNLASNYFYNEAGIYNENIDSTATKWAHDKAISLNNDYNLKQRYKGTIEYLQKETNMTMEEILELLKKRGK